MDIPRTDAENVAITLKLAIAALASAIKVASSHPMPEAKALAGSFADACAAAGCAFELMQILLTSDEQQAASEALAAIAKARG